MVSGEECPVVTGTTSGRDRSYIRLVVVVRDERASRETGVW